MASSDIMDLSRAWKFWIDVGGTFTDCLAIDPNGQPHQTKVLSSGLTKGRLNSDSENFSSLQIESSWGKNFWTGSDITFLDSGGRLIGRCQIATYDTQTGNIEVDAQSKQQDWTSVIDHLRSAQTVSFELDHSIPAPILAIRKILKLAPAQSLPICDVHLGTTRGTNALLTRSGAKTGFVTTQGFRDLLLIGDQARPHLFELTIRKPVPLFETAIEIEERILADGTIESSPDPEKVRRQLVALKKNGIESIAICLMHGFRFPQHEQLVAKIANEVGFVDIRLSSSVAPLIKILARAETTVLDAYLNPVLGNYLDQIQNLLADGSQLKLMTSAGGLVQRDQFSGKDSVLSGPAGGIVGAARVAQQAGFDQVLTFDMGGTSSDVGRFAGEVELEFETRKSDVRIMTPMVAIETVAAGGGSICRFDGAKLVVGPESATSDPGPACYGRGGPLTVTDVNLFLGRIVKSRFPFPLDEHAVESRIGEICDQVNKAGFELTPIELAIGFLEIANQNMASSIRSVSIARGYDPQQHVLVAFGGAGPQHGCDVAKAIGVTRILDHPQGSILSAVGIRLADQTINRAKSVLRPLNEQSLGDVRSTRDVLTNEVKTKLGSGAETTCRLDLRYQGTEACQTIPIADSLQEIVSRFEDVHRRLFGFTSKRNLEIVAVRVEGRIAGVSLEPFSRPKSKRVIDSPTTQPIWFRDSTQQAKPTLQQIRAKIFNREHLQPGDCIIGPAIVTDNFSSALIGPGYDALTLENQALLIEENAKHPTHEQKPESNIEIESTKNRSDGPDPVRLEIFNNHFSTIARQMGISLQMTSMSVNVKERLDFSCAIFTSDGDLVVNAPHIPVHLGAMSETVRGIIRGNPDVHAGDVFVTNDPFAGGSHLPDVTVVTPVFEKTSADSTSIGAKSSPIFWVASRSHHAEIGGITPGSMPPSASCLAEEGVLIRNFKLVDGQSGAENFDRLRELLVAPPYPSRSPDENLADIRAQVAANRTGQQDLLALMEQESTETVIAYMQFIQAAAEQKIRNAISRLNDGQYQFADSLDNGAMIRVSIIKQDDHLEIDFAGTDPVLPGNQNANPAIVYSAIIYVLRCLIEEDIPLNEGVMNPVSVKLPECFLNPASNEDPKNSPAVVGGNVETSQRLVDVILGALQQTAPGGALVAGSQGTMNNWLMGDDTFGYYETVGGGAGATAEQDGANAVHTHMTNTRLTDPEVLETRYPAILREFSIRTDSGGQGNCRGGDGMIREVEFTKPLTISLLTNRRTQSPYGTNGGSPGSSGQNILISKNGESKNLPSVCQAQVKPGDRLRIETPGGGGFGKSNC